MKTYKVKNYKGNLVESLSKFQKSHKGMKIVEACEDGDDLKIKAEESQKIEEAAGKKCWVIYSEEQYEGIASINGVFTSKDQAEKVFKKLEEKEGRSDFTWYCEEMDLDTEWEDPLN